MTVSLRHYRVAAALSALGLCVLAVAPALVRAQDPAPAAPAAAPPAGEGRGGRRNGARAMRNSPVVVAFKAVSPSADETAKFDALQAKFRTEAEAQTASLTGRERTAKTRELNAKYKADVRALLSADKAKQFDTEFALASVLGRFQPLRLTDDETAKIKPAIKDTAVQMVALQEDETQKPREKAPRLTALADELKAKMKPLLPAEKQARLETINLAPAPRRNGGNAPAAPPSAPAPPATP